jgi:hypothetical protein
MLSWKGSSVEVEQSFIAPQHGGESQHYCLLLPWPTFASAV